MRLQSLRGVATEIRRCVLSIRCSGDSASNGEEKQGDWLCGARARVDGGGGAAAGAGFGEMETGDVAAGGHLESRDLRLHRSAGQHAVHAAVPQRLLHASRSEHLDRAADDFETAGMPANVFGQPTCARPGRCRSTTSAATATPAGTEPPPYENLPLTAMS